MAEKAMPSQRAVSGFIFLVSSFMFQVPSFQVTNYTLRVVNEQLSVAVGGLRSPAQSDIERTFHHSDGMRLTLLNVLREARWVNTL